jgi:hemoglobin-like flavoprotein
MGTNVDLFRASLKRCLAKPDFLMHFYQAFLASSEEVRDKFKNTDFERQTRVLADSLHMMAVVAQGEKQGPAWTEVGRLARLHSRSQLDIRPGLYDLWLQCLLEAVERHDPEFSPLVDEAWRSTFRAGIEHMRSSYE